MSKQKKNKNIPTPALPSIPTAVERKDYSKIIKILSWIAFALYAISAMYGLVIHEPWRDEAQAWLLTRDASIAELFKTLPSEGHPPLWYILLLPLTKAGLPYISQNILTAFIMIAAVYILLFKTNVHPILRLLLPFSYYFFYEYLVFARNYCLLVFFVTCIISLYPKRFEKDILFSLCVIGLFNTHVMAFSFCFTVVCLYLLDACQLKKLNKRTITCIAAMCIGGLYLIPYLSSNEMVTFFHYLTKHDPPQNITNAMGGSMLIAESSGIAIIIFTTLCIPMLFNSRSLLLLCGGLAGPIYIIGYSYNCSMRHYGILLLIIVAAYAITSYYNSTKTSENNISVIRYGYFLLIGITGVQIFMGTKQYIDDVNYTYSGAKNAAEFIKRNHLDEKIIVAHGPQESTAVLPFLRSDYKFYFPTCHYYGTYFKYDSCYRSLEWAKLMDYAVKMAHDDFRNELDKIVLLLSAPVRPSNEKYFDLLYKTTDSVLKQDEKYYIYKIKDGVR